MSLIPFAYYSRKLPTDGCSGIGIVARLVVHRSKRAYVATFDPEDARLTAYLFAVHPEHSAVLSSKLFDVVDSSFHRARSLQALGYRRDTTLRRADTVSCLRAPRTRHLCSTPGTYSGQEDGSAR